MKHKLEFSQIFRRKINSLKRDLTKEYGKDKAKEAVSEIMTIAKGLATNPNAGKALSELYDIDTDYYYFYTKPNYVFYYTENDRLIVAEMFNEREDFMLELFGMSGRTQESIDYWGE